MIVGTLAVDGSGMTMTLTLTFDLELFLYLWIRKPPITTKNTGHVCNFCIFYFMLIVYVNVSSLVL